MYTPNLTYPQAKRKVWSSFLITVLFILPTLTYSQGKNVAGKISSFTAQLVNLEAAVHETFHFNATLQNGSAQVRLYELSAAPPDGWNVGFRTRGSQVTSVNIASGASENIDVEIRPAYNAKPGKYKIPVVAFAAGDSLQLNLEAVVRGSYGMELTTPSGLLSDKITEGKQKEIHLVVRNTGSLSLEDITLSAQSPSKWDAVFHPSKIENLEPGKTTDVVVKLTVPEKTIAGDYVTTVTARNNTSNTQLAFRMTVRTSILSGWIGILIILSAIALVFFLIRKYGRR